MQAKDINDVALLKFIERKQAELGMWVCVWNLEPPYSELPPKLFRAKTAKLIQRGLLDGCACGCRGDYELTEAGCDYIKRATGVAADYKRLTEISDDIHMSLLRADIDSIRARLTL